MFDFGAVLTAEYVSYFLLGVRTTLFLFAVSWVLAVPLAVVLTGLRATGNRVLVWLVAAYVAYHRNVPQLVQLLLWYFGIATVLPDGINGFFNRNNAEFLYAVVALTLNAAAYMSEDFRSGLRAIPRTQTEAARAIGFNFIQTMRFVVIPQTWRIALPPLVSQTLILFKGTSLAASISVAELTFQARQIESQSFRVFEAFFIVSVTYLIGSATIMFVGAWLAKRYRLRVQ